MNSHPGSDKVVNDWYDKEKTFQAEKGFYQY